METSGDSNSKCTIAAISSIYYLLTIEKPWKLTPQSNPRPQRCQIAKINRPESVLCFAHPPGEALACWVAVLESSLKKRMEMYSWVGIVIKPHKKEFNEVFLHTPKVGHRITWKYFTNNCLPNASNLDYPAESCGGKRTTHYKHCL